MQKIVAIVQAHMRSTRFSQKEMQPVCSTPMIGLLLEILLKAKLIDQIVLATSTDPRNEPLAQSVRELSFGVYQGSEDDMLDRYYQAAKVARADIVVRITGDCPLVDPELVDLVIFLFLKKSVGYATNTNPPPSCPNGLDVEFFTFKALENAYKSAEEPRQREHFTPYIRESDQFTRINLANETDCSGERWTVDEPEDLEVVRKVFKHFSLHRDFSWLKVIKLSEMHPEYFSGNKHLIQNEGAQLGTGQKLWNRVKRVIPGGVCLSPSVQRYPARSIADLFQQSRGARSQ